MTHSATPPYDRSPIVPVTPNTADCALGWDEIGQALSHAGNLIAVELYPGCDAAAIEQALVTALQPQHVIRTADALLSPEAIEAKFAETLGTDRVFAFMHPWTIADFFSPAALEDQRAQLTATTGRTLVLGTGATLVAPHADTLIYADLARWELQRRQRAHLIGNLGLANHQDSAAVLYKRAFFLDWRAADRLKTPLLSTLHLLLDTNNPAEPRLISGDLFRQGLATAATRPFRVVPFFDPGPWGGQWMKTAFDLPEGPPNYAWGFDCVPEENSLLLGFGSRHVEIPALDLVLLHPHELLGTNIVEHFGAEFPIRFDFLDTVEGGNLSLQVHPLRQYIREHFGMDYTQDESYYMLEATEGATVYLGLKEGVDPTEMEQSLRLAQADPNSPFPAERFVNTWPARKHDHFLIPAGTVHCSGRNGVVLEISATPYIFTFKLWDWSRLGLDGMPRPIHLEHGLRNIQWDRTTAWVKENLINCNVEISRSEGVREERTGLHELEFIETRRHWFTAPVAHNTEGTVNVLNLVEGQAAVVESPSGAFPPFPIHYGETFIVPAAVGAYTIRPASPSSTELATVKAYVRQDIP